MLHMNDLHIHYVSGAAFRECLKLMLGHLTHQYLHHTESSEGMCHKVSYTETIKQVRECVIRFMTNK